jgi:serine/threonine-protein kinase
VNRATNLISSAAVNNDQTLEMEDLLAMQLADHYVIHRTLAWGGDSVEYLEAERDGERLILCTLPELFASGDAKDAFVSLAESLMTLDVPTVLPVKAWAVVDDVPLLELGWEEGKPIATALVKGPLPSVPLLKVADQVLRALVHCHRASIVHGDLTPENIIVTRGGDMKSPIIRVIGVGLAELLRSHGVTEQNNPLSGAFAADYLPPEVSRGERASARSDLYCVGVLMHHMVIGDPPEGYDSREGFADIPQMPDVIRRVTARDPAERYSDAAGMLAALDWLDVISSKMSPHTQDIPLWMEYSVVGNIPVPQLNVSTEPPPIRRSSRPPPRPPSAPPDGLLLRGSHSPTSAHSTAPVRIVVSPSMAAPPTITGTPSVPAIPAAGVPRVKGGGNDGLWWTAAALCLVIILLVLGWIWLETSTPAPAVAPAPAPAPAAAPSPAVAPAAAPAP